jgi:arsenate reductase
MIIFYGYGKCGTCKQAIRFLEDRKIAFLAKEITETPPSFEELERMLAYSGFELKKLFNTSGLVYKRMELKEKLPLLSREEALQLLGSNGMLIKRPFVLGPDFGFTGFSDSVWDKKLS